LASFRAGRKGEERAWMPRYYKVRQSEEADSSEDFLAGKIRAVLRET